MISIGKIRDLLTSILSNLNNFNSRVVVDRVSETQIQVSENFNYIIWRLKGFKPTLVQCLVFAVNSGENSTMCPVALPPSIFRIFQT